MTQSFPHLILSQIERGHKAERMHVCTYVHIYVCITFHDKIINSAYSVDSKGKNRIKNKSKNKLKNRLLFGEKFVQYLYTYSDFA